MEFSVEFYETETGLPAIEQELEAIERTLPIAV